MTWSGLHTRIERSTFAVSSLRASGSNAGGGSMARKDSTWNRWVWTMSRSAPVRS
jgi:hypothetical protein